MDCSSYSYKGYQTQPLYYTKRFEANLLNKKQDTQLASLESILASDNGVVTYRDTVSVAGYMKTEATLKSLPVSQHSADLLLYKFTAMKDTVMQTHQLAVGLKNTLMRFAVTPTDFLFKQQAARTCLNQLTLLLNDTNLLSGVAQNKPVIDLTTLDPLTLPNPLPDLFTTVPNTDYYQGGAAHMNVMLLDHTVDKYPLTAADPFFANIIASCRLVLDSTDTPSLTAAQQVCDFAITYDFTNALQAVDQQLIGVTRLLNSVPKRMITQREIQSSLAKTDKYSALLAQQETQNSQQIAQQLYTQRAVFSRHHIQSLSSLSF